MDFELGDVGIFHYGLHASTGKITKINDDEMTIAFGKLVWHMSDGAFTFIETDLTLIIKKDSIWAFEPREVM